VNRPTLIGTLVFLVIGLGLLTGSLFAAQHARQDEATRAAHAAWPQADAMVVQMSQERDNRGEPLYRVVVAWSGPDGHKYQETTFPGTSYTYVVGQKIPARYDPVNPAILEREYTGGRWTLTAFLALMGSVFAGIAIRVALAARLKKPSPIGPPA